MGDGEEGEGEGEEGEGEDVENEEMEGEDEAMRRCGKIGAMNEKVMT